MQGSESTLRSRTAFWPAWSSWLLSVGTTASVLVYNAVRPLPRSVNGNTGNAADSVIAVVFIAAFATVGALLAWKRPSNPIGWLLCATGACYATGVFSILLDQFARTRAFSHWLGWTWFLGIGLTSTFVLLLFPTGTLPSRRWRPVAWIAAAGLAAWVLGSAFAPGRTNGGSTNPLGIGGAAGSVFKFLRGGLGVVLIATVVAIASLVVRYRRAGSVEREQLKWLVYAAALIALALLVQVVIPPSIASSTQVTNIENAIGTAAFAFVPIAIGIAVLKYRLYDIDVVINKTVVFGALAAFITAVYVAIVVGIGAAIGQGSKPNLGLSIVATGVVAVAFQPVRERVQRFANHLVYGERATPYEVLSAFSSRMAGTYAAEDLPPRMAQILAEGTGSREATVWLKVGSELRAEASWPPDLEAPEPLSLADGQLPEIAGTSLSLLVHHRGELLGALTLSKQTGERLTPAEHKLASDLASQAGLVLRNVRLAEELLERLDELQASRQRIVAAQDQERRRLERNIHDGAQQQLVALAVKIRLARQLGAKDPGKANDLLEQTEAEVSEALEDLRDLARGIYPPLLADKGLVAALEGQARRSAVPIRIQADGIGRYPQEAEAAVYFCALEALQNVAKYARASGATVRLFDGEEHLTFEVADDGVGFDASSTSYGTGLQGMADRLRALGGELEVRSAPGNGTTIVGQLPVRAAELVG